MDSHLTFALYRLVLEGHLPASTLAWLGHQHLLHLCESCRTEWEVLTDQQRQELPFSPPFQSSPPGLLPADDRHVGYGNLEQLLLRQERRRRVAKMARRHLAVLRGFPPQERAQRIVDARTRYRTRAFAELLIEESRRLAEGDPREAENLASLVPTVLEHIPDTTDQPWLFELAIRARAWAANAQRVAGDLATADRAFAALRAEPGLKNLPPVTLAELAHLEACLLIDQRKLPAALRRLEYALMQASVDPIAREEHVTCLLQMGLLLVQMDRPEEALAHLREAEPLLGPPERNPQQHQTLLRNRVAALQALGREGEAEESLAELRRRQGR